MPDDIFLIHKSDLAIKDSIDELFQFVFIESVAAELGCGDLECLYAAFGKRLGFLISEAIGSGNSGTDIIIEISNNKIETVDVHIQRFFPVVQNCDFVPG